MIGRMLGRSAVAAVSLVAWVAQTAPGGAGEPQLAPSVCAKIGNASASATPSLRDMIRSVEGANFANDMAASTGDVHASIEGMMAARAKLLPALKEFTDRLEDMTYQMRRCARG